MIECNNSILGNRAPILVIAWLIVKNYLLSSVFYLTPSCYIPGTILLLRIVQLRCLSDLIYRQMMV